MKNEEIRNQYNQQISEGISKLEADIKLQKRNPNMADAKKAWEIRHQARLDARAKMNPSEAKKLSNRDMKKYGHPDGPTFQQTLDKCKSELRAKGLNPNNTRRLSQAIIDSSKRTDHSYNLKNFDKATFDKDTRDKINAKFKKLDVSRLNPANDNQVPPKPPREPKNKPTAKEQLKQRYGKKPTEAQSTNAKALKDRSKINSNQGDQRKDSTLTKDKPSSRSSDRHAKKLTVSQSLKKQGLKEKMATVRNQKRDQTMQKQKQGTLDNNGLNKKGNEIMHGKGHHAERIKTVVRSMRDKGYTGIRVNQTQVDATGKQVGKNKPDISAIHPKTGKRINIEYDNKPKSSLKHEHHINKNDSKSINTHAILRPDGKVLKGTRTYKPNSDQRIVATLAKDKSSHLSNDRQAGRSTEAQSSKRQGTKEKMTSLRNQSRDRRESKEQTLKKSGDNKATRSNNTKENLKPLSNKTKDIQGNNKALNEKSKVATNPKDRSFAKDKILSNRRSDRQGGKSTESQALKKHGAKEKMAAVRVQSREKYQKRNQSLKQSGDQKVKQPKNTSDNVKGRYGKSSESSQNKASSSNRETTKSVSSSRSDSKPKSTQEKQPKPSGDSKPSGSAPRDGGNRRR